MRPMTPMVLMTFMLAQLYFMPRPMSMASGMVATMVKSPRSFRPGP